jgi:O-antigen ligase
MVLSSIVLPAMLVARTVDLMRSVFLCFAVGSILNVFFVLFAPPPSVDGYSGYVMGKNALGEFSAITLLMALNETRHSGSRRVFGIIILIIAILLLKWANSKTALGLVFICPLLAGVVLIVRNATRISPAILLLSIPLCFTVLSTVSHFSMGRLSFMLYGDPTFTGRTFIWDFVFSEIARRPLLGWGYKSFWLVGSDAPSVVEAPRWVGMMPNAHNGYYDTMLELGYVGYGFLIVFILANLHAIGRVADSDRGRAWFALTIALYVIIYNYLESIWMRGFDFVWVVFVLLAVDVGRCWQPFLRTRAVYGSKPQRPGSGPLPRARTPGPRIPMQQPGLTRSVHQNDRNGLWKTGVDRADGAIGPGRIRTARSDGPQS